MLLKMRDSAGSWITKILLGILALSFALWGVGDVVRGMGSNDVARVGDRSVSAQQFRAAYDRERQVLARRLGKPLTAEQAQMIGLPDQVLDRLLTENALDEESRRLGIGISDGLLAREIVQDSAFRGRDGAFSKSLYLTILQTSGLSEAGYLDERRRLTARRMILKSLAAELAIPSFYAEVAHRLREEKRNVSYLVLPASKFGVIAPPGDDVLKAYFEQVKGAFKTAEHRRISLLALDPAELARTIAVSDDDAKAFYEKETKRFTTPEKRNLQQINFADQTQAESVSAKLHAGQTFDTATKGLTGITRNDLGTLAKNEVIDPLVREAAFALKAGDFSPIVASTFGPVVVHVTAVQPASVISFEAASAGLKKEIAEQRAQQQVMDLHDKIEEERQTGAKVSEIAAKLNLTLSTPPDFNREGLHNAMAIGLAPELVDAVFQASVDTDNEPLQTGDKKQFWYEVNDILPEKERSLDVVRAAVVQRWTTEQQATAMNSKAQVSLQALKDGKTLAALALDLGLPLRLSPPFTRKGDVPDFTKSAVDAVFRVAVHQAGTTTAENGKDRLVFTVTHSETPPFTTPDTALVESLTEGLQEDLLSLYLSALRADFNVKINTSAMQKSLGLSQAE